MKGAKLTDIAGRAIEAIITLTHALTTEAVGRAVGRTRHCNGTSTKWVGLNHDTLETRGSKLRLERMGMAGVWVRSGRSWVGVKAGVGQLVLTINGAVY